MTHVSRRGLLQGAALTAAAAHLATAHAVMPRGLSQGRFLKAVAEYRSVVGHENVLVEEDKLVPYRKMMIPAPDADHRAAGAIAPASVEEVREVVAISAKHRIPLWTISTGKNFGYGTSSPALPGQMVLDLGRMNRILDFDPVLGTVLLEPGVTYQQLSEFLASNNHPFIVTGPGAGPIVGPVGQALERGRGYTPYSDQFAHMCGLEVVLATGEVLRTGAGGITGSTAWQADRYGYGPVITGLFSQSNFGVVTKMGLWLMPKPQAYRPFLVGFRRHEDLAQAVAITQHLRMTGVIRNGAVVGNTMYAVAQMARRADVFHGKGPVTDQWHTDFMQDKGGVIWGVNAALYGTEAHVAADWQAIEKAFAGSGGILLGDEQLGHDPFWRHSRGIMNGQLSLQEYGIYNWRGGGGSAWFAPMMAARSDDAMKTLALGKSILHAHGFDYIGGYLVNERDMIQVIDLLFDRRNPEEAARAQRCFKELVERYAASGYGMYRTNIAAMEAAAQAYGPVQRLVNKKLKRALDPTGILAPGKSGITL